MKRLSVVNAGRLKIDPKFIKIMADAYRDTLKKNNLTYSEFEQHYIENGIGKDPVRRAMWDLHWKSTIKGQRPEKWVVDNLYPVGINDNHIESVLKMVTKELKKDDMKRLSVINRKAEQDGYKTYVLFKVAPNPYTGEDEIDAFFQYKGDRSITVYSHVGQHGEADKRYMDGLKNASPKEYAPLMKELNSIGYDVVPVKKFTITDPDKQKRSVSKKANFDPETFITEMLEADGIEFTHDSRKGYFLIPIEEDWYKDAIDEIQRRLKGLRVERKRNNFVIYYN